MSMRPRLEARLNGVLEAGRFILGDMVAELEDAFPRYCGVRYGVAVASGTDALWLALEALGVGAGDEVITVSNTCVPTIAAILQSGATPVLVDIDPGTFTMDPELAEASLPAARSVSCRCTYTGNARTYGRYVRWLSHTVCGSWRTAPSPWC